MKKESRILVFAVICMLLITPLFAGGAKEGANFPTRQIQNIFPWSAGVAYAVSQIVAEGMGRELGETMVVTSTTGAGGVKAAMTMMSKPADGYTVFDGYVAPLLMAPIDGRADYTYKDFKPLYGVASNAFAIACRPDETRWNDLTEFVEYAASHPGELSYSAGADLSLPHMVAAVMLKKANAVCRNIPYNDTGESFKEFLSGELDFMVINSGNYKTYKKDLKVLAVMSDFPMSTDGIPGPLPKDFGLSVGVKGLAATGWTWWVVNKDTPDDVVAVLRDAMKKTLDNKEIQEKISKMGFTPLPTSEFGPDDYLERCAQIEKDLRLAINALAWEKEEIKKY